MGHFSAVIAEALQGRKVNFSYLVELRLTTPAYFWNGVGSITVGGHTWIGAASLGSIDGIEEALRGESAQIRIRLSGANLTSQLVQTAAGDDPTAYVGKLMVIWLQFFTSEWATLGSPRAILPGIMDGLVFDRQEGENNTIIRTLTLTAENMFYNRRIPANSYYTDTDQKLRYPGDRGMEFIPSLQEKTIPVPW